MRSLIDTVRYVVRKHPEAQYDNVVLTQQCWAEQIADGNTNLFDPASLIRTRQRLKGNK